MHIHGQLDITLNLSTDMQFVASDIEIDMNSNQHHSRLDSSIICKQRFNIRFIRDKKKMKALNK